MRLAALLLLSAILLLAGWRAATSSSTYAAQDRSDVTHQVSCTHPAGLDELGRDRATRISVALILSLTGAVLASALASALALMLASLAAFGPNWFGRGLLYFGDLFLTLPWLFLLMLVRSALPLNLTPLRSEAITFLLLAILGAPAFLRIHHQRLMSLLRSDWLLQARSSGMRAPQMGRGILPHALPLLWTQFLLYLPACLIAEANLGTLGLGLSDPLPSFGTFLANLQGSVLMDSSRMALLPVAILVLALGSLELTLFGSNS